MANKQIFNHNCVFAASAGVQTFNNTINCPFKVGRIVFHPPRTTATDNAGHFWLLRQSITNNYSGFIPGRNGEGEHQIPITITTFQNPLTVAGVYMFQLVSGDALTGNANVDHVGTVWAHIEFHEA